MAVVPRKRKSGVVYYVANQWRGRPQWERVGTSKRQTEIRDRAMKKEIAADEYEPPATRRAWKLGEYAEHWASQRTNANADAEERIVRLYVQPVAEFSGLSVSEVRPRHINAWVRTLKTWTKADGSRRLSDKTIRNAVDVLRTVFTRARHDDLVTVSPVELEPKLLDARRAVEPTPYTAAELLVLIRHHAIPHHVRALNALCLLAGLREGEAVGRRWGDIDWDTKPLPAMRVHDQYNRKPLKTKQPRRVPVHPELARVLLEWARDGYDVHAGHAPSEDDLIVPSPKGGCYSRKGYYSAFIAGAEAAGVSPRTLHATRHTFITLCRRGGARQDVLAKITHNARGEIIDGYTHWDWLPLCEAVLCLDVHQRVHPGGGNSGELGGNGPTSRALTGANPGQLPIVSQVLGTRAVDQNQLDVRTFQGARQDSRQEVANRQRIRRLETLRQVDPEGARPGLAVCRGLEQVLAGDTEATVELLRKAAEGKS